MEIHPTVFKVRQVLEQALSATGSYVLAVSGGADSMALADGCAWLHSKGWGNYTVCHVEHGLRGQESIEDMELVRNFCATRGLPCFCKQVRAKEYSMQRHLSIEVGARELRYSALREVLVKVGGEYIVTAHHLDDQAETVLLRLLRGTGMEGIRSMEPCKGDILRPFLTLEHTQLEEYCKLQEVSYNLDNTNNDSTYTRNRIRLELLPYLRQNFNPNVSHALARTAALLREDEACLDQFAVEAYINVVHLEENNVLLLSTDELLRLPRALQSRVLRKAYFVLGGGELAFERTQALLQLCSRGTGGKSLQLPGKITAQLKKHQLILYKS